MAKEKEKAAKAAPAEDLVEKPREPMFSTAGMVVFAGSLVLVAVIVFFAGMFIFGADPAPADQGTGGDTNTGKVDASTIEILQLTGITAQVPMHGGGQKKVRFNLNIQFGGTPEERTKSMEWVKQAGREAKLIQMANEVMSGYDFEVIQDATFARTFERAYRERFNNEIAGHQILEAKIYNQDWN
jgi:hypothetical protein